MTERSPPKLESLGSNPASHKQNFIKHLFLLTAFGKDENEEKIKVGEILFALLVRNMTSFCEKSVDTYDALGSALLGLVQ